VRPEHATSYLDVAAIAVIATLLASLVTNLSATLLLVPFGTPRSWRRFPGSTSAPA